MAQRRDAHLCGVARRGWVLRGLVALCAAAAVTARLLLLPALQERGVAPLHVLNLQALVPRELRVGLLEQRHACLLQGDQGVGADK
jgi:hypothetical protein